MTEWLLVASDVISTGGMDLANLRLAQFLARRGDRVEVVTHRADATLHAHPNATVRSVPRPLRSDLLGQPVLDIVSQRAAARVFARGGRVICNGGNCRFGDVNWVHYLHAAWTPAIRGNLVRRAHRLAAHASGLITERRALRGARVVIANSRRTAEDLQRTLSIPSKVIHVVYCGIDPEAFGPPTPEERAQERRALQLEEGQRAWMFVGALGDRRKGFDTLFEAWRKSAPGNARLFVVGAGAELPTWRRRAAAAGFGGAVHFLGYRSDVARLLAAMDGLVAPTRYEPFGLAVLEAICRGVPAIVSRSAGVSERYPSSLDGLLIDDPDDAGELARRLTAVSSDLQRWREAVAEASASLRRHTWDAMSAQIVAAAERG